MKLLFKQRFFSWLDSYDIFDEAGNTVYTVRGEISFGHLLRIYGADSREIGHIKQEILTFLPQFHMYLGDRHVGSISKEFALFANRYSIDCKGWRVEGDPFEWEYDITDASGRVVATVSKELFRFTDTYVIDVREPADAIYALMLVLAIDAERCSRD